jgi:hypothetical protein
MRQIQQIQSAPATIAFGRTEIEEAVAQARAELKALEPKIMSDPVLRELYELIPNRESECPEANAPP